MISRVQQQGLGLVEILVSLLLLAIAVLGFSALQINAVKATDESLIRSDSLSAMRNLAEDMRLNVDEKQTYQTVVNGVWSSVSAANQNPTGYCAAVASFKSSENVASNNCVEGASCDAQAQVNYNSYQAMQTVCNSQMMMNMVTCPGTANSALQKFCIVVSWDNTIPEMAESNNACADVNGVYKVGSSCFIMEAY